MKLLLFVYTLLIRTNLSRSSNKGWMYDALGNCLHNALAFCAPTAEVPDEISKVSKEVQGQKRAVDPIESFIKKDIIYSLFNPFDGSVQVYNQEDIESGESVAFDQEQPLKVLIHGVKLSQTPNNKLKDTYLDYRKYYVITVNWGQIKDKVLQPLPSGGAFIVGRFVADMLEALYTDDQMSNVHIIGHGHAAHSAGHAGRLLRERGYDVGRITGLDAANPYIIGGLNHKDATFVDVIHTNAEKLEDYGIIGHADFYPNGGRGGQPSCRVGFPPSDVCNTLMAYEYFEETVRNGYRFLAMRCESPEELEERKCDGQSVYMGEDVDRNARGQYYLKFTDTFGFS